MTVSDLSENVLACRRHWRNRDPTLPWRDEQPEKPVGGVVDPVRLVLLFQVRQVFLQPQDDVVEQRVRDLSRNTDGNLV